ncbi:MAG: GNAT family N-acetyltransferase [Frankiales bacterium]|nr:GNAT family N-acetyltransferase [Frankiales bacterium]
MTVLARREDGLEIDDDPDRVDLDTTVDLVVRQGYWANARTRDAVAASIRSSWVFGVYDGDRQIGFARAVTDRATFAWICDVIVDEGRRGQGVGTWLMRVITGSLDDAGVPRQILATLDAHEVYRGVGYSELAYPERWMERDLRPDVPPRPAG